MRVVMAFILIFISTQSFSANLQGVVFEYECKNIDPKVTGFTCAMNKTGNTAMKIHLLEDFKELPKKESEYKNYRYNSLLIRYFDLGGKVFSVTAAHWKNKKGLYCSRRKMKYSYMCDEIN